ncbi:hypothetical protein DOTSEDRAFT_75717 [Dothistroma septosporum NZE10]|uniref:UTP23 sensor motif region domain-containing protein n=1 Tax=Dothistroma septosporum (strain NZE10 / CBS 128990) TaxID=675120 RepID=N1PDG4_DOTSN|nr:hypothetical protein DOTSEDRAFT_75717 [Dothistroma septosporum NZE10]
MKLGQMLENTLHGEIKPMISQCCIRHLYNEPQSPAKDAWIETAKQAERRRCGHHELEKPLSALECIMSCVDPKGSGNNKNKYVVATQELDIRQKLRAIPGVPLVYINRSVMILEPMASTSEKVKEVEEKAKIRAGLKTRRGATLAGAGEKRKRDDEEGAEGGQADGGAEPVKKKTKVKGPKGPNPMSVKKAQKDKPKSVGKQVEEERSVLRKAAKQDPQVTEKARSGEIVAAENADGAADAVRKRKRKRKPKENVGSEEAGVVDAGED